MTRSVITNTGVSGITISSANEVTMSSQPAFLAVNTNSNTNIATNNTEITIEFDTERYDVNSDFNTSTFLFTAPVDGKYQLNFGLNINQIDTATTQYTIRLNTSNRNYITTIQPSFSEDTLFFCNASHLCDMDANDTAKVTIAQNGGTAQTDIRDDPGSHFSGFLAC